MSKPNGCVCQEVEPPYRDTVKSVIINTHLKDTLPDIDKPRPYNAAFEKNLPMSQNRNMGINTEVRALLNAPLKSRFEEFDISVREAIYKSQQNEQLGMPRKSWAKPDDVTNFSRTFGDPSGSDPKVYEIILPPDVPKCVQNEWRTCAISKRRNYGYNDAFNHEHTFGDYYHPTYDGRCAKMCLNWLYRPSDLCVISNIQGEVRDRTWAPDGMVLEPLKNRSRFCVHHAYGLMVKPNVDDSVAATLRDCPPCKWKSMVIEGVKILNAMRLALKSKPGISFPDIIATFRALDKDRARVMPNKAAYLLFTKLRLSADFEKLDTLLRFIRILDDNNNVCYEGLINIFNIRNPYPMFDKIQDLPPENRYYSTTYRDLQADRLKPFVRNYRRTPPAHDCDRTHITNPNACERNGLWHRDYLSGRTKDVIRDIFASSGYEIPAEQFERSWSECAKIDQARLGGELVCVETFRDYVENPENTM